MQKTKLLAALTFVGLSLSSVSYAAITNIASCQTEMHAEFEKAYKSTSINSVTYYDFFTNAGDIPSPNPGSYCNNNVCSYFVNSDGLCFLAGTPLWNKPVGNSNESIAEVVTTEENNLDNNIFFDGHSATISETCPAGASFNSSSCSVSWVQDH